MFASLILIYFIQLNLLFSSKSGYRKWRETFIKSGLILFTTIVLSTELLSCFYGLNAEMVIIWWMALNLILGGYLYKSGFSFKALSQSTKLCWGWLNGFQLRIIWGGFSLIYLTVLVTALFAPPNTVDVLTYHMPRVAHWVQAGSVEFYATHIERQLFNPPLSEYFFLQLHLLSGSDRFANLVQFFSFLSCGILTSLISARFRLDYFGQLLTVLITATISMAILQGSSSKNDLVAAFFVTCFFYFFVKAVEEKHGFIYAGLSLGLALLTKGNAYFFCFPIAAFVLLKSFWSFRVSIFNSSFFLPLCGVFLLGAVINFGHFYRNWKLYETPVKGEDRLKNEQINLPIIFANVVRNYAVHLGTNFDKANDLTVNAVEGLLGKELNNPASTVDNQRFMIVQSFNEETAGNPLHLFLLTLASIYVFFSRKDPEKAEMIILSLSIIVGFILFCTFLKWNFWVSRVHSPLFILGSPLIALLIVRQLKNISFFVAFLFFISAFFTIYVATPRSLIPVDVRCVYMVGRGELYYAANPNLYPLVPQMMQTLKDANPTEIGLDLSTDTINYNFGDWEYLFWIELKNNFAEKPILRNINVENPSNRYEKQDGMPEWVISTKQTNILKNVQYEEVSAKGSFRLLRKKEGL